MKLLNNGKLLSILTLTFFSTVTFSQNIQLIKEFSGANSIDYVITFNNKLFFAANDGTNGQELWTSNGTQAGTFILKDIVTGSSSSSPEHLKVCGDKIYFVAKDPANTALKALFVSDGTTNGTNKIITLSSDIAGLTANNYFEYYNGKVYFKHDGSSQGFELWSTDGTLAGTQLVKNINPGSASSNPDHFYLFAGKLFFNADNGANGKELWATSGTTASTVIVNSGTNGITEFGPRSFFEYNNILFYEYDGEIWACDGTTTSLFLQIHPDFPSGARDFINHQGKMYFSAKRNGIAQELYVSDGTQEGTAPVQQFMNGYFATKLMSAYNQIFFSGHSDSNGQELWSSGGEDSNTNLFANLNDDSGSVKDGILEQSEFILVNDTLYFTGSEQSNVIELFYTLGVGNAYSKILFPDGTTQNGSPKNLVSFNNELYFLAKYTSNAGLYKIGTTDLQNSIAKINDSQKLVISPNPSSETLTFTNMPNNISEIVIKSSEGKLIRKVKLIDNQIKIDDLQSGFYTLTFTDKHHIEILTRKIIKN